MFNLLEKWLAAHEISEPLVNLTVHGAMWLTVLLATLLAAAVFKRFLIPLVEKGVHHSSNRWDDTLVSHKFFRRVGAAIPLIAAIIIIDLLFPDRHGTAEIIRRLVLVSLVMMGVRIFNSFLNAALQVYNSSTIAEDLPLRGYVQVFNIFLWVMAAIFAAALMADRSPWGIMSVLGGLTAVLLLIFKDTILGFVASLQISANNMVRIGDWIEMPDFGADGDVFDVSIHTVKVRNWDKTITTIPTYALVSHSFKNWRGMQESGGRRIKRAVYIDMNSIRFCDEEMLARFGKFEVLKDYLAAKQAEIDKYNREHNCDLDSCQINGRRQTNIGVFRAYLLATLRNNPKIHQEMTFLVRHRDPTPQGLPVEIYVFSRDQVWANYEAIQADIFDHVLAALPVFDLRVFQYPSGRDLAGLNRRLQEAD
ncbi:MAG: mechanosensitive ion channel [Desulfurivibrionaceae bacterium]|nr:mechanosensitive ion channel [Desulfurivibrionaceae bacterium]